MAGRILAIDYGTRRVGLAVSDPLQIIAHALDTVESKSIWEYLTLYFNKEDIEMVVIGLPKDLHNRNTDNTQPVKNFMKKFSIMFPHIPLISVDERFTSKIALDTLITTGIKKMERRDKSLLDKVSATLILQTYLYSKR